jgi:hypothetical protein
MTMRKWRIALVACAGILVAAPQAFAQASNSGQVITTVNGETVRLLGFIATGPQPDLDRLRAAAATANLFAKEPPPPDGPEIMVMFQPGSDPQAALAFLARAQSAEFSTLKIGVMTYPVKP